MLKKALTLCIIICLCSINAFAGAQMIAMTADYSAVQGPVREETVTVKPEAVRVLENESAGTQTITYYSADELPTSQIKTNIKGTDDDTDTNKTWFYLKIPKKGLTNVTIASAEAQLRYNNSNTTFYVRGIDRSVWESATSELAENKKTLSKTDNDTLLSVPTTGKQLYSLKKTSTVAITGYTIASDELTQYINSATDGNAYFAVYASNSNAANDGGATVLNSWVFTLTGTKPVGGISANIEQQESVTVQPDVVHINEKTKDSLQMVEYYSAGEMPKSAVKSNTNGNPSGTTSGIQKAWFYMRVPVNRLTSISHVSVSANIRFAQTATKFYITSIEKEIWDSAVANLTDGKKTLNTENGDTLFAAPVNSSYLCTQSIVGTDTAAYNQYEVSSEGLTEYANSAEDGYAYIAVHGYNSNTERDGMGTYLNKWSFTLTGTRLIEGPSISGNDFTYSVTIEKGENVRLIVGVYDSGDNFIGAQVSTATISDGETAIELPVSLSEYTDAAYIKAYMWRTDTLVPYFTPIKKEIAKN